MAQRTAKQRRADNARQAKLAQLKAAERRRRARIWSVFGAIGVVVVIVLIMVGVKLGTGTGSGNDNPVSNAGAAKVAQQVTSVPASVFAKIGPGTVSNPPKAINGQSLTQDGKPKVLYVGGEFCPYCAAERWAVVAALSRFGTWSDLGLTTSSSHDVFPDTPTLSFHGASYTSDHVAFSGFETTDRDQQPLDTLPSADQKILNKYGVEPYVPGAQPGQPPIPFVYFGGKYLSSGASYDPGVLKGLTHSDVAKAMHDPSSDVAKAVDGSANAISAAVCKLTNDKPANVCSAPGVRAAAAKLQ